MISLSDILKYLPKLWKVFAGSEESKPSENDKVVEILKDQLNKEEARTLEQDKRIAELEKENADLYRMLIRRGRK